MPYYRINQFQMNSAVALSIPLSYMPERSCAEPDDLTVCCDTNALHEFPCVHWLGRRNGGQYLCAYDVGNRILICAGNDVKMAVDVEASSLIFDLDTMSRRAMMITSSLITNLGVSLCTLLRGDIPLHGAGVEVDGKLIGIMAPSGTGKSTLLWKLLDEGARFANDDILPIRMAGTRVQTFPSISLPAKLSKRAMEDRGMDWTSYQETLPGEEEFWIPIEPQDRLLEPRPLAALFVLQPFHRSEVPGQISVQQHIGGSALSLLMANTQGLWAAYGLLDARRLFAQYLALAQAVPIYTLEYHRRPNVLPHLVTVIRNILDEGPQTTPPTQAPVQRPGGLAGIFQRWIFPKNLPTAAVR